MALTYFSFFNSFPYCVKVARTIIHPSYDSTRIVNDLALLRLDSPVPMTEKVRPVCLPTANQNFEGKTVSYQ